MGCSPFLVCWWYSTAVDKGHLPRPKASHFLVALKVPVEPIEALDFFSSCILDHRPTDFTLKARRGEGHPQLREELCIHCGVTKTQRKCKLTSKTAIFLLSAMLITCNSFSIQDRRKNNSSKRLQRKLCRGISLRKIAMMFISTSYPAATQQMGRHDPSPPVLG